MFMLYNYYYFGLFQINSGGIPFTVEQAPYVWIPPDIAGDMKFRNKHLSIDLCPNILNPFPDPPDTNMLLCTLIDLLEKCLKHNFITGLLTLGACVQTFHYKAVVKLFGGCPITVEGAPVRQESPNP